MTTQIRDTIYYLGSSYLLSTELLHSKVAHLELMGLTTAQHKGYDAVWSVIDKKLFLVAFSGVSMKSNLNGIRLVFPNTNGPVLAEWFSGEVRIQKGRFVTQDDFDPQQENEVILTLNQGTVIHIKTLTREVPLQNPSLDPFLSLPIEVLDDVSPTTLDHLKRIRILKVIDLIRMKPTKLMRLGLTVDAIDELEEFLACRGLIFGMHLNV
jgi:hypothetical protein